MLNEALSSGLVPRALLAEAETPLAARFPEARLVTRGVLEAVCDTKTPQGMCAAFETAPAPAPCQTRRKRWWRSTACRTPATWAPSGARRTRRAWAALLLGANCADPYSPKVQRAAMGSGFRLPAIPRRPALRGACIPARARLDGGRLGA